MGFGQRRRPPEADRKLYAYKTPLNRRSAPYIVRFFDYCYKRGVWDACDHGDDYEVRGFLEEHVVSWRFAVLGEPCDLDWETWRFLMYRWAKERGMNELAEYYIYEIVRQNHLWYFLPYCMRFYLKGMADWLKRPEPGGIDLFMSTPRERWVTDGRLSVRMVNTDYVSDMHMFAFEYRRVPEDDRAFSIIAFEQYARAIHDLTRKWRGRQQFTYQVRKDLEGIKKESYGSEESSIKHGLPGVPEGAAGQEL